MEHLVLEHHLGNETQKYHGNKILPYFVVFGLGNAVWHYLFGNLYNSDNKFKELWYSTPKISADGPHYIQHQGLLKKLSDNVKNHINEVKTPLYKLSYKYNNKRYNKECNLSYLLNSFDI